MKKNVIQKDGKYYQECKVVMLPTKDETKFDFINNGTPSLVYDYKPEGHHPYTYQHLYIISDEEIKEGDWCIVGKRIVKAIYDSGTLGYMSYDEVAFLYFKPSYKKIIATTDKSLDLPRPSNEFIQKYVELQGKIDKVLVEYDLIESCLPMPNIHVRNDFFRIKTASDNTITIRPVEIKKDIFSREEVEELCRKAFQAGGAKYEAIYKYRNSNIESSEEIEKFDAVPSENKWIKENL